MDFGEAARRVSEAKARGYNKRQTRQCFSLSKRTAEKLRGRAMQLGICPTRLLEELICEEVDEP